MGATTDIDALRLDAFALARPGEPPDPRYRLPSETARFGILALRLVEGSALVGAATVYDAATHVASRFFHVRTDRQGDAAVLDGHVGRLVGTALGLGGAGKPLLVDFEWAHAPVPEPLLAAFARAGFVRADQAVLARPIGPATGRPAAPPLPDGYALRELADGVIEPAVACMVASPEPGVFLWTPEFCRRAFFAVADPEPPRFPEGRAQAVFRVGGGGEGGAGSEERVVAFVVGTLDGTIQLVYTHPEHRGRGLAAACLIAVLETFERRGLAHADVPVLALNEPARRFYEGLGFRERRRYPQLHRQL